MQELSSQSTPDITNNEKDIKSLDPQEVQPESIAEHTEESIDYSDIQFSEHTKVKTTPLLDTLMKNAGLDKPEITQRWQEVDSIRLTTATGIVSMAESVQKVCNKIELTGILDDPNYSEKTKEYHLIVNGFSKDLENITKDIVSTQDLHKGKKGLIRDGAEYISALAIVEGYQQINHTIQALIAPALISITEFAMDANNYIQQEQEKNQLQDPNVISDVNVKVKNA